MKNLKEEIRLFQDAKDNKTTIIIWNMSDKTKKKLAELLLGDLQCVETVEGVESTKPDLDTAQLKDNDPSTEMIESFVNRLPANLIERMNILAKVILTGGPQISRQLARQTCEDALHGSVEDNVLRGILYAARDFWDDKAQNLIQALGYSNNAGLDNEKKLQMALTDADRNTLEILVGALVDVF